jgi:hypothetical protein
LNTVSSIRPSRFAEVIPQLPEGFVGHRRLVGH